MLMELIALLVLAAPERERIVEPASPADRRARVAYFDSLVKDGALVPCQERFPDRSAAFAASQAAWTRENAARIDDGKRSVAAVAGPDAADGSFQRREAQAAMQAVLSGLPASKRLAWCLEHFPVATGPRASYDVGLAQMQDDDDGNDARALQRILDAADDGLAEAEVLVAMMHLDGAPRFAIAPDVEKGLRYLARAAEHGQSSAQLALGMHYASGDIVARDPAMAEKWLTLGVLRSDAAMHAALADMFEKGEGVPHSLPKAFRFYRAAADMGHAWAAGKAARMLLEGVGTPRDPAAAYYHALIAVQGGNADAASLRDQAGVVLDASGRARAEERFAGWAPRAPEPSGSGTLLPVREDD